MVFGRSRGHIDAADKPDVKHESDYHRPDVVSPSVGRHGATRRFGNDFWNQHRRIFEDNMAKCTRRESGAAHTKFGSGKDDDQLRLYSVLQIECKDWRCAGDTRGVNDIDGLTSTAGEAKPSRVNRFELLYAQHYGVILAYAIRRTSTRHDAQDVVAEVFTTAWRQIDRLSGEDGDRLWLYGIARRVVARHYRGRRRRSRLRARLTLERSPTQTVDQEQPKIEMLRLAIERLSPLDREALKLVMWDQLSHEEAAQILGCTANALGVRLHRARNRLKQELGITDRVADSSREGSSYEH